MSTIGQVVAIPNSNETILLKRRYQLSELSRIRRQFITFSKTHPVDDIPRLASMFTQYLTSNLSWRKLYTTILKYTDIFPTLNQSVSFRCISFILSLVHSKGSQFTLMCHFNSAGREHGTVVARRYPAPLPSQPAWLATAHRTRWREYGSRSMLCGAAAQPARLTFYRPPHFENVRQSWEVFEQTTEHQSGGLLHVSCCAGLFFFYWLIDWLIWVCFSSLLCILFVRDI